MADEKMVHQDVSMHEVDGEIISVIIDSPSDAPESIPIKWGVTRYGRDTSIYECIVKNVGPVKCMCTLAMMRVLFSQEPKVVLTNGVYVVSFMMNHNCLYGNFGWSFDLVESSYGRKKHADETSKS